MRPPISTGGQRRAAKALFGTVSALVDTYSIDGISLLFSVASDLFEAIDTPVSLSCEILLRYNELEQLCSKSVVPSDYCTAFSFEMDYQAVSLLRKVPFPIPGIDRTLAAKKKFLEAEERCKGTNVRIRNLVAHPERASTLIRQTFCLAIERIQDVLGTRVSYVDWLSGCRFGPGTFNHPDKSGITSVYDKLQVHPSVTEDFRSAGAILVMSSPSWARSVKDEETEAFWPFVTESDLTAVPGNRITFVPKTAMTDRAIAIEPLLNVYAQLGLGRLIRGLLREGADIDLNSQEVNQQLAKEGSIHGFLATIDLSSASDTVAKELVRALLPEAWFLALDSCRSKVGFLDGEWIKYEKFSSMGNGYTFELETLIFWALTVSACEVSGKPPCVSVYGDDIVVPVDATRDVKEVLEFFGFDLNLKKTFFEGPFRESCGKDYYNGVDVRPFFQEAIPNKIKDLVLLANGIRRRAHRSAGSQYGCDLRYRGAYRRVLQSVPVIVRRTLKTPAHAGDLNGFVTDWDEAQTSPFVRKLYGWDGWFGLGISPKPLTGSRCSNFEGGVATLLYRARSGFKQDYSPADPRQGRDVEFKLKNKVYYGPWTNLGPWL